MGNYVRAIDLHAWWDFAVRGSAHCIYAMLDWAFLGMYKNIWARPAIGLLLSLVLSSRAAVPKKYGLWGCHSIFT
jgi:hypothetical protein